jgi:hypothetical protein
VTAASLIKRTIVAMIALVMLVVFALTGLYHYVDRSPEAQQRLELSAKSIEGEIDEETGFMTTLSLLVAAWWDSDKLVDEAKREKSETAKAKAEHKRDEEARRFNDSQYNPDSDYYPNGS